MAGMNRLSQVDHQCLALLWVPRRRASGRSQTSQSQSLPTAVRPSRSPAIETNIVRKYRRTLPSTLSRTNTLEQVSLPLRNAEPDRICTPLSHLGRLSVLHSFLADFSKPGAIFARWAPRVPPKEPPFSLGHDPWCFRTSRGKPTRGGHSASDPPARSVPSSAKPKTLTAPICIWEIFSEVDDEKNL